MLLLRHDHTPAKVLLRHARRHAQANHKRESVVLRESRITRQRVVPLHHAVGLPAVASAGGLYVPFAGRRQHAERDLETFSDELADVCQAGVLALDGDHGMQKTHEAACDVVGLRVEPTLEIELLGDAVVDVGADLEELVVWASIRWPGLGELVFDVRQLV